MTWSWGLYCLDNGPSGLGLLGMILVTAFWRAWSSDFRYAQDKSLERTGVFMEQAHLTCSLLLRRPESLHAWLEYAPFQTDMMCHGLQDKRSVRSLCQTSTQDPEDGCLLSNDITPAFCLAPEYPSMYPTRKINAIRTPDHACIRTMPRFFFSRATSIPLSLKSPKIRAAVTFITRLPQKPRGRGTACPPQLASPQRF